MLLDCYWIATGLYCNALGLLLEGYRSAVGFLADYSWVAIGLLLECYNNVLASLTRIGMLLECCWIAVGLLLDRY